MASAPTPTPTLSANASTQRTQEGASLIVGGVCALVGGALICAWRFRPKGQAQRKVLAVGSVYEDEGASEAAAPRESFDQLDQPRESPREVVADRGRPAIDADALQFFDDLKRRKSAPVVDTDRGDIYLHLRH